VQTEGAVGFLRSMIKKWSQSSSHPSVSVISLPTPRAVPPKIGLALGGGFARGVAHVGILRALEHENIPIHCIAGVSAGAIVAAAYASGTEVEEIGKIGCAMRFADVARWSICRLGLVRSERMAAFLRRLLKKFNFEEMELPLGILATDLGTGESVPFREKGDVIVPIRASCSYPGLFRPIHHQDRLLVDGAMSMEVPALLARKMGATHVISVCLPMQRLAVAPQNMLQVINRCFQILQSRTEDDWRKDSDLVVTPDVTGVQWDAFESGPKLIDAGEKALAAVLPKIKSWLVPAERPAA